LAKLPPEKNNLGWLHYLLLNKDNVSPHKANIINIIIFNLKNKNKHYYQKLKKNMGW
jgi:hypothetical protein